MSEISSLARIFEKAETVILLIGDRRVALGRDLQELIVKALDAYEHEE